MEKVWLTLNEAAEALNVSPRTIRRWIQQGKLEAQMNEGPYGPQYQIDADKLNPAQEIKEVVKVNSTVDMATLANVMGQYLNERESVIAQALSTLREEVRESARKYEETEASLREELTATKQELAAALDKLSQAQGEAREEFSRIMNEQNVELERKAVERDQRVVEELQRLREQREQTEQAKSLWQRLRGK